MPGNIKVDNQKTLEHIFMKGCYFFHGDMHLNKSLFSKNAIDRFDTSLAEKDNLSFWESFVSKKDYYLFKKFFEGKRTQISGAFEFITKDNEPIILQCILQREDSIKNTIFSGVLTELSLGYSTKSVSRLKEVNGFRSVLNSLHQENKKYGIMIIGIDNFKDINELYTYSVGDELMRLYSQHIEHMIDQDISLYQLDGDAFGILYPEATLDDMRTCFHNIQTLSQPLTIEDGTMVSFTISGGISMFPYDGSSGEELYRNTRVAFNEAKNQGKDQYVIYNKEISERASILAKQILSLKESVRNNFEGFSLAYQPLVLASDNELFGCEVLLRWQHPNFPEGVSPTEFIPLLEKSGLILEVGRWIIDEAFKQKQVWNRVKPDLQMNINVAADQFREPDFIKFVMNKISEYRLDAKTITLELTESGEIKDAEEINKVFDFFRSQHIKIALDDFGTGYDSLSCLRVLSSDVLKIDRSFLERITYNIADQQILLSIIELCKRMKIDVCIEGVENEQVSDMLKAYGARLLQGYFFSKPIDAQEFSTFITPTKGKENDENTVVLAKENSLLYSEVKPAQAMNMNELVDQAYGGIFQVGMDHEFTFLTCNEGYRKLLGYTAKEIDEKFANKALGFVHPDDVTYVNEEIRRQLAIADTICIEFRVVRKDGTPIWIVGTGNVVRSYKRNPSLVVMIINNDEAKKQNLIMREKYELYQSILNNIPGGVKCVRFDESFTLDYISPSFLSILGYSQEDMDTLFDRKYINMIYEEDIIRVNGDIMEQLKVSDVVTLHYRSYCKDGSLVWLETVSRLFPPNEEGIQLCYSSVINVTDTLSDEEKNKTANFKERFQIAAIRWGDVLFEVDLNTHYVSFSETFKELFNYDPLLKLEELYTYIHKEDQEVFANAMKRVLQTGSVQEVEVRIKNTDNEYSWCSFMFDEPEYINHVPCILMGKLKNIHKEKLKEVTLIQKAEIDSVTGLYNKGTIESKIRHLMDKNEQLYALYMIDIDDFKLINDCCGHLFGDYVLQELAKRLQDVFDFDAIIGRAGGDEFLVFSAYSGDPKEVEERAKAMLNAIQKPFVFENKEHQTKVSIGISCFPKDGTSFYELFAKADSALYRVKQQDKNNFSIY